MLCSHAMHNIYIYIYIYINNEQRADALNEWVEATLVTSNKDAL